MKKCCCCSLLMPLSNFYKHPTGQDGRKTCCRECYRNKTKTRYAINKSKGYCVCCTSIAQFGIFCEKHLFMDISKNRLGTKKRWIEIKQLLLDQKYLCAYSEIHLILGNNASLEHKIPLSKGGTNELSNICWIDLRINIAKGAMTYSEFYEFTHHLYNQLKKP